MKVTVSILYNKGVEKQGHKLREENRSFIVRFVLDCTVYLKSVKIRNSFIVKQKKQQQQ